MLGCCHFLSQITARLLLQLSPSLHLTAAILLKMFIFSEYNASGAKLGCRYAFAYMLACLQHVVMYVVSKVFLVIARWLLTGLRQYLISVKGVLFALLQSLDFVLGVY